MPPIYKTDADSRLASSRPQFAAKLFAHLIHRRAVARGRQVLWPGRFATERTGSVLDCTLRMRDRAKRLDAGPGGSAVGRVVNKVGFCAAPRCARRLLRRGRVQRIQLFSSMTSKNPSRTTASLKRRQRSNQPDVGIELLCKEVRPRSQPGFAGVEITPRPLA